MSAPVSFGGIGQAFRSRNFTIFWWGQLNLSIAAWVFRLALAWIVWELTQSTAWLGIVAAAQMLPILLLCPIGGVTADRWGAQRQLVWACAAAGATGLALAVMAATGTLTIAWVLVLSVLNGATRAFTIPPRQAIVPSLVEPHLLPAVLGFQSATYYGANFIGPAIGGFLIATFGVGAALGYFAFGAAIAVVTLPFLKLPARVPRLGAPTGFAADLVEGFRYTARHPGIRLMILYVGLIALCMQPVVDMLASVADNVLVMGPQGLAMLASTFGCGAMAGGLWIAWRGRTDGLIRILLGCVAAGLIAQLLFAASGSLWLSMPALFAIGVTVVITNTATSSLIQNTVDPSLRARVMAFDSMLSVGAPSVGAVLIGWAGSYFGIQAPLAVAAVVGLAIVTLSQSHVRSEMANLETGRLTADLRQPAE